jgi:hypothetical protein
LRAYEGSCKNLPATAATMANIHEFPAHGSGGGPHDPALSYKVGRLEEYLREIKDILRDMQREMTSLQVAVGEMRGELRRIPTVAQAWAMTITTWIAGAGVVMLAVRLIQQ